MGILRTVNQRCSRATYRVQCGYSPTAILCTNRPFPSSKKSHFQNEAKCEAIDMKMIFNYYANKTHFHNKVALSLVLKVRFLELGNGLFADAINKV